MPDCVLWPNTTLCLMLDFIQMSQDRFLLCEFVILTCVLIIFLKKAISELNESNGHCDDVKYKGRQQEPAVPLKSIIPSLINPYTNGKLAYCVCEGGLCPGLAAGSRDFL